MSKSKKEKTRLLKISNLNDDYSSMKEEHLKIRYRYYGSDSRKSLSHFYQKSMISEKCKELMSESFKRNIKRLLLPIAKQLGEFDFQINVKCYLKKRFDDRRIDFSIDLSLLLIQNSKRKFGKVWMTYKNKKTVRLGSLSFNNENKVPKHKPFLKGNFNKMNELCEEKSLLLDHETNMWLIPNINFHNPERFALTYIKKETDFCYIRDNLNLIFKKIKNEYDFDMEEIFDSQIAFYYKIGEKCYWAFILDENLSINTLINNFGKEKEEVDIFYQEKDDISILGIVKILDFYGFIEKENIEITEDNVEDVIAFTRMVKY